MEEKLQKQTENVDTASNFHFLDDRRSAQIESTLADMKRWRPTLILILVLSSLTIVLIPSAIIIIVIYETVYQILTRQLAKLTFQKTYAYTRKLQIEKDLTPEMLTSRLSQKINPEYKTSYFFSIYKLFPIKHFELSYTVGNKNKTTYDFTVSEITIEHGAFPYILLHRKGTLKHQDTDFFGKDKDVEIKTNSTNTLYCLYTRSGYEIEALQICTTDFIELIQSSYLSLSVEFAKNHVYIYTQRILETEKDLDELYRITHGVIDTFGDFLTRMKDDYEALNDVYANK